jgi:hypothetical protein
MSLPAVHLLFAYAPKTTTFFNARPPENNEIHLLTSVMTSSKLNFGKETLAELRYFFCIFSQPLSFNPRIPLLERKKDEH